MNILTLDFETFYSSKDFSLSKMTTIEYVHDERFKIIGAGVKLNDEPTQWLNTVDAIREFLDSVGENVILLAHNTAFDGYILHVHFGYHPEVYADTMGMSRGMFTTGRASLEKLAERLWPNDHTMRKGKELVKFDGVRDLTPEQDRVMAGYCIQDVELTYAAYRKMEPFYPDEELALIDLTARMYCDPVLELNRDLVQATLDTATQERDAIIQASGLPESVLSSNNQFADWIEAQGIEMPRKVSLNTGQETDALGKNDLEFQLMRKANPHLEHVWEGRVAAKSIGEISRAKRFLNLVDATGGPLPVPLVYYSAHCVPGDTEVLTQKGWVPIKDWKGGVIAQVSPDKTICFDKATRFVGPEVDEWVASTARYVPCAFTLGHRVPYLQHGTMAWAELPAAEAAQRGTIHTPIAGTLTSTGSITPEQIRVLVMVQADGSFCQDSSRGRQLTVFVKKPRKIERARQLFVDAQVPFRELEFPSHPGYVRFAVSWKDLPEWLQPDRKFFGNWLLDSTPEAREAFVQELRHWDGGLNGGVQWSYSTSVKTNAEWAVTLCHLTGRSASIATNAANNRDGYNRKENYVVNIRQRDYAQIKREHWVVDRTRQRTYCTQTKTGFWLARANGRIFITGNTGRYGGGEKINLQNLGRTSQLRRAIRAPKGKLVYVADSSNIEARMNAWHAGQTDLLELFRQGADVYSLFASESIYHRLITKKDNPTERFVGKVAVLGLGYRMGHARFRATLATGAMGQEVILSEIEAAQIVRAYRSKYSMIERSWRVADSVIIKMMNPEIDEQWGCLRILPGMLVLPNGMALQYPHLRAKEVESARGIDYEYEYWNGKFFAKLHGGILIENIIQALSRIVLFTQMLQVQEYAAPFGGRVALNVHDEIITVAPDFGARLSDDGHWTDTSEADEFFEGIQAIMRTPPAWCADLPLDCEGGFDTMYSK